VFFSRRADRSAAGVAERGYGIVAIKILGDAEAQRMWGLFQNSASSASTSLVDQRAFVALKRSVTSPKALAE
jgi:hypothetical protein